MVVTSVMTKGILDYYDNGAYVNTLFRRFSLPIIQQKIFDIQMDNTLLGHIHLIHANHKLRKVIFNLEQIAKLPFLCFFVG